LDFRPDRYALKLAAVLTADATLVGHDPALPKIACADRFSGEVFRRNQIRNAHAEKFFAVIAGQFGSLWVDGNIPPARIRDEYAVSNRIKSVRFFLMIRTAPARI